MDDKPYMNGKGLRAKTVELTEQSWQMFGLFILGLLFVVIGAGVCAYLLTQYEDSDTLGFSILGVGIVLWIALTLPWVFAVRRLDQHAKMIDAETKKRGNGWADS